MRPAEILIVDDEAAWAEAAAEALREVGFQVNVAYDAEQALDATERSSPALLILDVHLPGMDGIRLLRELRQRNCQVPAVMISADDQAAVQDRAMHEGAAAFLRKPIPLPLLMRAVNRYLPAGTAGGNP